MKTDIKNSLFEVIAASLGIKKEIIKEDSRFIEDLSADSLDIAELMVNVEEKFGCKVVQEDVEKLKKVKDLMDYLHEINKG